MFLAQTCVAEWPQILGSNRDGHAIGKKLDPWTSPPAVKWRVRCGAGYAGVAVAGGNVLLWHREDDKECLDCLSSDDGSRKWRAVFPAVYRGGVDPDLGPRCVPVIDGEQVYVYGAAGDLQAVGLANGKTIWSRPLRSQYEADEGYFGAGSTPLVIGDQLVVAVGGEPNAGLIALNKGNGETRWTALEQEAAYSSPVPITLKNKTYVAAVMRLKTVIVDPTDGTVLTEFEFGRRGPTVNAATPLVDGSNLFVTAAYGVGCRMLDLAGGKPTDRWGQTDVISSQYVTPVRCGQWLFAITGREDYGNGELLCARWADGKEGWRQPEFGTAHLIAVGDRVLAQKISGELKLFAADGSSYQELASATLPTGKYRALPAFSEGVLYCRRIITPSQNELIAIRP
ncbi:outer membrane protein assembly factor BamB family protein [Neorhodopirellula pilleata]|nr:PQQ-binding-like beta-propeller repeat protein [Neorhodopirellula pilleata]